VAALSIAKSQQGHRVGRDDTYCQGSERR
jgi:hypothetical protein